MKKNIVGREEEQQILNKLYHSTRAEFLAVYGRRRIGKSFLIREYFDDAQVFFEIVGNKKASSALQVARFVEEIETKFNFTSKNKIKTWEDAFSTLVSALTIYLKQTKNKNKVILFFDELPWLAGASKSTFLSTLEYYWNKYFEKMNILLIVCGSAASWMIKRVINNKTGLYNRLTKTIRLSPFTLLEVERFLQSKSISYERSQIVELYMAIGGIPKYLNEVQRGLSPAQNIDQLCFSKNGALYSEFNQLFESLFDNYEVHLAIVKVLANAFYGLEKSELLKKIGIKDGGTATNYLKELEESGFIIGMSSYGKHKKNKIYRLIDEYSLFYLKWIEPLSRSTIPGNFWIQKSSSNSAKVWAGYAFENVILHHIPQLQKALGISGILITISSYYSKNAQIDLIVDRSDKVINICEIKYHNNSLQLTKSDADQMNKRKEEFRAIIPHNQSIISTLITVLPAKKNAHFFSSIDNEILLKELFV